MKKVFLILSLFFVVNISGFSQIYVDNQGNVFDQRKNTTNSEIKDIKNENRVNRSSFDMSKLSVGGNFSLQLGDYTVIGISPQVGYDFSKYFTAGAGLGYTYFKDKSYNSKWSSSYLSFDVFGRFYPIEYIVLGVQPEMSRMWQNMEFYDGTKYNESKFVPSFLVGGGIHLAGMIAMVQYDLVQDVNSPYGNNLFYSIGYTFRF